MSANEDEPCTARVEDEIREKAGDEAGGDASSVECEAREEVDDEHLDGLSDGSGCTEVWEYLSERRGDGDE